MTKKERDAFRAEHGWMLLDGDVVRIEIGVATFTNAIIDSERDGTVKFHDAAGNFWTSTQRYTIVMKKEDEESDKGESVE